MLVGVDIPHSAIATPLRGQVKDFVFSTVLRAKQENQKHDPKTKQSMWLRPSRPGARSGPFVCAIKRNAGFLQTVIKIGVEWPDCPKHSSNLAPGAPIVRNVHQHRLWVVRLFEFLTTASGGRLLEAFIKIGFGRSDCWKHSSKSASRGPIVGNIHQHRLQGCRILRTFAKLGFRRSDCLKHLSKAISARLGDARLFDTVVNVFFGTSDFSNHSSRGTSTSACAPTFSPDHTIPARIAHDAGIASAPPRLGWW